MLFSLNFSITIPYIFSAGRSVPAMGFVVSNAIDMAQWLNFLLAEGLNESGEEVVSWSALKQVFEPEMALPREMIALRPEDPVTLAAHETYAKGWRNGYYRGRKVIKLLNVRFLFMHVSALT